MKLRSTEVDGVPVLWAPGQGTLRASLWFRAGMVDETMPTRGWLHLLEHLALHGRDSIRTPVNGHVSLLHTSFDVTGEPEDVVAFLRDVCRWVGAPDLSELEHERRVLRAEGSGRGFGEVSGHLLWRYGARGPGLVGDDEFGLYTADEDRLRELAGRAFAQGNAVLALSGPPPAGLALPLPPGPRLPTPVAVPCDQPQQAGIAGRPNKFALSGTLERSYGATALQRALERDLQRGLRHDQGVGYSAWSSYEMIDAHHALVTAGMDVVPEAVPVVVAEATAVVRRLRDRGPDPTELRDDLALHIRRMSEEPAERWLPFLAASDTLLDRPASMSVDEVAAEIDATTVADVQRAAYDLWTDLLVSVDPDGAGDPQLDWLGAAPAPQGKPSGRSFRSIDSPESNDLLFVSETGARLQTGSPSEARYDELAGVLAFEDGGRRLVRQDGFQVPVEPTLWRKGREAVALVDAAVPEGLRIPLPARSPEQIPWKRVRRIDNFRNWVQAPKVWVPALWVCVVLPGVVALSLPGFITKILLVGSAVGVINFVRQQRGQ
ncbi:hypothetical protein GCM10009554_29340 [Kribbella koreensis]|uniref:Insulinase family protein n=2 Tax=Kribbella TaxID=182639 RepID=A0ABP6YQA1_9ACTN